MSVFGLRTGATGTKVLFRQEIC